jgi:signal transduction histidine kinase
VLSRFLPDRLSQWLGALVVGSILLTQALALTLYHADLTRAVGQAESAQAAQCLAGFAQMLGPESPDHRRNMMRRLMFERHFGPPPGFPGHGPAFSSGPGFSAEAPNASVPPGPPPDGAPPPDGMPPPDGTHPPDGMHPPPDFLIHLPEMPPSPPPFFGTPDMMSPIHAERLLPDGTKLSLDTSQSLGRMFTRDFIAYIAALIAAGLLATVWAVSLATRPLRRLSDAADRLGGDVNAAPLPESGPREVKQAAAAFNRMQRRLRQFIADRTRMLAAISHDLRTPLTRMRLRTEMIDDAEQRSKMLSDLQEMEDMVGATLAFAREEAVDETSRPENLRDLLETIVAEGMEAGLVISLAAGGPAVVPMRPRALKRALVNLVDNAVRYGGGAEIALGQAVDEAVIRIVDHGPGVPEIEREAVLRPFYRCEASRSRDTGGIGLGLSIASDTISAHGGAISLSETPGGGLTVTVRLPGLRAVA